MPTSRTVEKPQEIYQIKVTLMGTDPPICRQLLVPASLTLERLHDVLQLAVGWEDCHMHEFRIGKQVFGTPNPMEQAFDGPRTASEPSSGLPRYSAGSSGSWNRLRRNPLKARFNATCGSGSIRGRPGCIGE